MFFVGKPVHENIGLLYIGMLTMGYRPVSPQVYLGKHTGIRPIIPLTIFKMASSNVISAERMIEKSVCYYRNKLEDTTARLGQR